jgi:hypothetical protein
MTRVFDSQLGHWTFQLTLSFQPHNGPGVDSASKINEYQDLLGGKERPVRESDNLSAICEPLSRKMWGTSTSHKHMSLHGLLQ